MDSRPLCAQTALEMLSKRAVAPCIVLVYSNRQETAAKCARGVTIRSLTLLKEAFVTVRLPLSRRALPRAVILAVSVALIPLPASAGNPAPPTEPTKAPTVVAPEPRPLRAAIEKLDSRDLEPRSTSSRTAPRRSDRSAQADTVKQSRAFFKTGPGIAVLAVIAAGFGYALYSTSHDRINSPGKE